MPKPENWSLPPELQYHTNPTRKFDLNIICDITSDIIATFDAYRCSKNIELNQTLLEVSYSKRTPLDPFAT